MGVKEKEFTKCKTQDKNIHAFEGIKTLCGFRKTFTMEFSSKIEVEEITCKKCKRQVKIRKKNVK